MLSSRLSIHFVDYSIEELGAINPATFFARSFGTPAFSLSNQYPKQAIKHQIAADDDRDVCS